MDDTEDDRRYPPPNGYHPHHDPRSSFLSSSKCKVTIRDATVSPQFDRKYTGKDYEDESEEEEINGSHRATDYEVEEDEDDEVEVEEDEDDEVVLGESGYHRSREEDSSPDNRGKRKKLNKFKFAPGAVAPPTPVPSAAVESSKPPARNNPADWTEESTFVLLDAWGILYVKNGRKSLRSDEWMEVSKKVNKTSRTPRSDSQCRNRIDTLKKKYKKEKSKIAESMSLSSKWIYFKKMEELMGVPTPSPAIATRQQSRLPSVVDSAGHLFANSQHHVNWLNSLDVTRDILAGSESMNDDEDDDDESEGLPPECTKKSMYPAGSASFRLLAESIQKFSEIYERIEHSKWQHMAELQKMRREFQRDLEMQKGLILDKAQEELEKLREEESDGEEGNDDTDSGNDDIDGFPENSSS